MQPENNSMVADVSTLAYSHSALKDFENCPLAFYEKRVKKSFKDQPMAATDWGVYVHKCFEDRVRSKTPLPETLKHYERLLARFDNMKATAEMELTIDRRLKMVDWFSKQAFFRAKLDLVVETTPESIWLADYKAGKRRPETDQLERSAWMLFRKYPEVQVIKASFVWLKDNKLDTEAYTRREHYEHLGVKLMIKIKEVERAAEAGNWPARPSGLCSYCGHKPHCIYAKR